MAVQKQTLLLSRRVFCEDLVKSRVEKINVGLGEKEGRTELDDVVMRAVSSGQDAALAQAIYDVVCLRRCRCARFAIRDEVEAEKEAGAANVTEQFVLLL